MSIRTTLSTSFGILGSSLVLCCKHPYLLLYKLLPIAAPVLLIFAADMHRMFDLVLHYRPVMTAVFYGLIGLNIFCTVYLARRTLYLLHKKEETPHMVHHTLLLWHTLVWIALVIGSMLAFSRMTQWIYLSIKNPSITKYAESYTTLITHGIPSLLLLLTFLWSFTTLVPIIIATQWLSLYKAIRHSCAIIGTHFFMFIIIWCFFSCLDLLPIALSPLLPRTYPLIQQIVPYVVQLVITTLNTVTYCLFYHRYKADVQM
jgi:hypothetical protein